MVTIYDASLFGWTISAVVFAIIWIAIAFWPARVALRKGHSFILYFIFSIIFFPLALITAYLVHDRAAPRTEPDHGEQLIGGQHDELHFDQATLPDAKFSGRSLSTSSPVASWPPTRSTATPSVTAPPESPQVELSFTIP